MQGVFEGEGIDRRNDPTVNDLPVSTNESEMRYRETRMLCSKCRARQQKWLGVESMEVIGWRKMADGWWCPFCTGSLGNLFKIFGGAPMSGGTVPPEDDDGLLPKDS